MSTPNPVPLKDIDDAIEALRKYLVENGVLDIRLDGDRMMLEIEAIEEGREYDGPSVVGETIPAVGDPKDVDQVATAAMGITDPSLRTLYVVGHVLFWLTQTARPIVGSGGPRNTSGDDERMQLIIKIGDELRMAILKLQKLVFPLINLADLQDRYVREIYRRTLVYQGPAGEEPAEMDEQRKVLVGDAWNRGKALLDAYGDTLTGFYRMRYYAENAFDLPQTLRLAAPRTLDEWRQCQRELESLLLDSGLSSKAVARIFNGSDPSSAKKLALRRTRRRTGRTTVLLDFPDPPEEHKAECRNDPGPKRRKKARSPGDGDRSRTSTVGRGRVARAGVRKQRAALDKSRPAAERSSRKKKTRPKGRS